jgi:hypothetical protein
MKNTGRITFIAILTLLVSMMSVDAFAQTRKTTRKRPVLKKTTVTKTTVTTPVIKQYTVETGQKLRVRMNDTISSKTAKMGDTFTVNVTEPVYSNTGVLVIPSGSTLTGKVIEVKPAAKGGKPGTIDVDFIEVKTPNGTKRAISGTLTELESKSAKSDNEGTASGDKMKHRKIIFIGGGGAGGAIIGGMIGGPLGAAIGAGAGALGGLITENQTKGEEATVKAGTEFGVMLNKPVALPKFVEVDN